MLMALLEGNGLGGIDTNYFQTYVIKVKSTH